MVGRKGAVPPSDIIDAVLTFKERVVLKNEKNEMYIVAATNQVWTDIRLYIGDRMSSNAIHTFVQKGRHGIMEKLGFPLKFKQSCEIVHTPILPDDEESPDDYSSNDEDDALPCKKFVFTFSSEEWDQIQPQEKVFKLTDKSRPMQSTRSYYVLPKGTWTPILAEHFWAHFQLPCCLSFRRGKVYPSGSVYIRVVGRCSVCDSRFNGTVFDKPPGGAKVLMHCTFRGNFQEAHKTTKKRRMIGPAMEKAISSICVDGLSSETYREREAVRLIKTGAPDPSLIPSGNSLRILKSQVTAGSRRHEDTLTSLALMKQEDDFKNIIHDIGCDPFYLHYHCADQIKIYRNYRKGSRPRLIIDATGSVVKKFLKLSKQKTSSIFLYEGLVYDS
ncbi:unnamed protein product [Macrosiphum euphorbiae]|uniref:Uncharacterized protein n=1 Tax=Macrosiphum euphorbiae TaxID=13131 RepID=A0AAV0WB31_9HEMI|nr:unnamed protein product [Macrosiphum euphorbiae]